MEVRAGGDGGSGGEFLKFSTTSSQFFFHNSSTEVRGRAGTIFLEVEL